MVLPREVQVLGQKLSQTHFVISPTFSGLGFNLSLRDERPQINLVGLFKARELLTAALTTVTLCSYSYIFLTVAIVSIMLT
jgi:hypothetical protein